MRGYAVILGAIALLSWSCQLQSAAVCSPGEDRCACADGNLCNAGLTCVSGTCFDLSSWLGTSAGANAGGAAGLAMSVLPGVDPSAPIAGSSAGAASLACAALSGDCSAAPCCAGGLCVLGFCAAQCKVHQDCTSGCCIAHDANIATCFEARACLTPAR